MNVCDHGSIQKCYNVFNYCDITCMLFICRNKMNISIRSIVFNYFNVINKLHNLFYVHFTWVASNDISQLFRS